MKITFNTYSKDIPREDLNGTVTFASFNRIVSAMLDSNELILRSDECISAISISDYGLYFKIESK